MTWKGITGLVASVLVAGFVAGLVVGLRGCGGSASKLLQENAELKADVSRFHALAKDAQAARALHATARHDAERALAAAVEHEVASADTVRRLRARVAKAGRQRDERNDLIDALDRDKGREVMKNGLLTLALESARLELQEADTGEQAWKSALEASERRGDKLERHIMKERPKRILIGVGSALGGAGVVALAVAVSK